jgi:hypothetical protein
MKMPTDFRKIPEKSNFMKMPTDFRKIPEK